MKLNINLKSIALLGLTASLSVGTLSGCVATNRTDKVQKNFNVAIETNGDNVSIVGIDAYSDYDGSRTQFITEDNMIVLTSTLQTQLVHAKDQASLDSYAFSLSGGNEANIIDYNKLQEVEIDFSNDSWNNDRVRNRDYNKAIILSDDTATVVDVKSWVDSEEDDILQLTLCDETCILTTTDRVKLINDQNASKSSLKNYALSLVGDKGHVVFHDVDKQKTK